MSCIECRVIIRIELSKTHNFRMYNDAVIFDSDFDIVTLAAIMLSDNTCS